MLNESLRDNFFCLREIADWQLKRNQKVKLPALQRTFVWKPHQIETVWDSILRGYPIGSFLMNETYLETLELLDGQQRCTSISLGFFNPWDQKESFFFDKKKSDFEHIPTVWIDLHPQSKSNTHKYLIRVTTQSHPWGYQAKNHTSILSVSNRKKAFMEFTNNIEIPYNKLKNTEVYPYDAHLPVPLVFILEMMNDSSKSSGKKKLLKKLSKTSIKKEKIDDSYKEFIYSNAFDKFITTIKDAIEDYRIPAITIKNSILQNDLEIEGVEDNPTLFVRLNSQGTPIGGEELIYSIYKAAFSQSKDLVESINTDFMLPSRLISLTNRLVWSSIHSDAFSKHFNVNQFRERMNNKTFAEKLRWFIGDESKSAARDVFSKSIEILSVSQGDLFLPPVLVKMIINDSLELYLFLLYWIYKHDEHIKESDYSKIRTKFIYLCWFSLDKNKLCKSIWRNVSQYTFWNEEEFNEVIIREELLLKLPAICDLKETYNLLIENNIRWCDFYQNLNCYKKLFHDKLSGEDEYINYLYSAYWKHLTNLLAWNRGVVIFCQKKYFSQNFKEFNSLDILIDTNKPWDYDHIYPRSWVYNKRNINPQIKEWHNMNANIRAISLEINRSEGDNVPPSERLKEEEFESFFIKNDYAFWCKIDGPVKNESEKELIKAMVTRTLNMYEELFTFFS